jgi:hypothetical protein
LLALAPTLVLVVVPCAAHAGFTMCNTRPLLG